MSKNYSSQIETICLKSFQKNLVFSDNTVDDEVRFCRILCAVFDQLQPT